MSDKAFILIVLCGIWTLARVMRHWDNNLMWCDWDIGREDGPWLLFYPLFAVVQVVRYGILPAIFGTVLYIIFC